MSKKLAAILVVSLVLVLSLAGCSGVKGGGWFPADETDRRVTFSINLNPLETSGAWTDVEGTLQLNDPSQRVSIHGISKSPDNIEFYYNSDYNDFYAYDVKVNGEAGYWMYVWYYPWQGEDWYWIGVFEDFGGQQYSWWVLRSDIHGNISIKE